MRRIDLNCDLAELENGSDIDIMPYISSCNIACGGHAGSNGLMTRAVEEALKYKVTIGAHPGYPDRMNFGRVSIPMTKEEIQELIIQQMADLQSIVTRLQTKLGYVKLHGALYHDTARDKEIAEAVFLTIKTIHPKMGFLGMKGTFHERAEMHGLAFYAEAFADRRYHEDGSLVPRNLQNSVLESETEVTNQVMDLINQFVRTANGKRIDLRSESICIHGDHPNSLQLAKAIKKKLSQNDIVIKSFLE